MGDLTSNFSRSEFACKCGCGFDTMDWEVVTAVQEYLDHMKKFGRVIVMVNSGCRCEAYNKKIAGSKNSLHTKGRAMDIQVIVAGAKVDPRAVAKWFEDGYPHFGIGVYPSFTHIDSRSNGPARWEE